MPEPEPIDESVAVRLRRLRGPRPQSIIADEVGVTLRAYQQWEAGGGIAWRNIAALAKLHTVSPDWLLSGSEPVQRDPNQQGDVEGYLAKILEMMAVERDHRDRTLASMTELVNLVRDEWVEIRLALKRPEPQQLSVASPEVAPLANQRLDSIEEKLQSLLGLALEQELEAAVEGDKSRELDETSGRDESSR